jgi:YihY family inner membrane protein
MSWTEHPKLMPWRRRSKFVDLVFDIVDAYTRHRTGRNASLLAYMGILTVFPLLLCATTVLGLVLEGNDDLQEDIVDSALSQIPVVGAQIQDNQGQIDGNWWALVIGLAIALWGSMRAFLAMQTALDDIWEVETGRANFVMQRVKALIGIGVIGASQIGNVVLAALVGQAGLPRSSQVLLTIGGLAINVVVIGSMYRWLTSADVTWSMLWPGTLSAAFVYTALQFVGTNLMAAKLKDSNEVYGVFGSLIALAAWISLHAFVALIGAELNAALCRRRRNMPTARTTLAGSHA